MAIPSDADVGLASSTNKTKMFLAKQLNMAVLDFFRRWESEDPNARPSMEELRERVDIWFRSPKLHEIFSRWLDWCEDHADGYPYEMHENSPPLRLKLDPLTSTVFRRHFRQYLFEDFADRFKDVPEILTQLAWLVGDDEKRYSDPADVRVPNLADDLGL